MCSGLISMAPVMGDVSVQNGAAHEGNFEIRDGVLIKYNGFDENVVIPEGVAAIGESVCAGCESLKSLKIRQGLPLLASGLLPPAST
ncbi:MAG: leucine-rich repeat domain-containing protein [Treponema sp.]|jgi:hypothetical protein|nr:leucine-rich repeat domain-containing protein [Treponema sp.]